MSIICAIAYYCGHRIEASFAEGALLHVLLQVSRFVSPYLHILNDDNDNAHDDEEKRGKEGYSPFTCHREKPVVAILRRKKHGHHRKRYPSRGKIQPRFEDFVAHEVGDEGEEKERHQRYEHFCQTICYINTGTIDTFLAYPKTFGFQKKHKQAETDNTYQDCKFFKKFFHS